MLKNNKKILIIILAFFSLTSLINILMMYWLPLIMPTGSFLALRLAFISFVEKQYHLLILSVLISVLLFLTTFSIKRDRVLFPVLSLLYILCDFAIVFLLFVEGLGDGYWTTYIMQLVFLVTLIVLLCKYCCQHLFSRK